MALEERGIGRGLADEFVVLRERGGPVRLRLRLHRLANSGEPLLGDRLDGLVRGRAAFEGCRAGLLEDGGGVAPTQAYDAPQGALPHTPAALEELLAEGVRVGADGVGLGEDPVRLARGIEQSLGIRQLHRALTGRARMTADEGQGLCVADLDLVGVDAHEYARTDRRRARRIPRARDLHRGVVLHCAGALAEVPEGCERQGLEIRPLLLEHLLDLALGAAVDALRSPRLLPVRKERVLVVQGLEAPALQGGRLGMLDGVFHGALAVGVSHPRRVGDHPVVGEHRGIQPV